MFLLLFGVVFLQVASSINIVAVCISLENLLQFVILNPVTAALMHRTVNYVITCTPQCFVLAVAAVSAKVRAILLSKSYKILQFLSRFVKSAHDGQFCARRIAEF